MYEQVPDNELKYYKKLSLRGDWSKDTLDYFSVKDPKFARFYLLPKIHKRLHKTSDFELRLLY